MNAYEKLGLDPFKYIRHGTPNSYKYYKCRCDKCKKSWAKYRYKYNKAYRASKNTTVGS